MKGKLVLPADNEKAPVVVYVQNAEGFTRDILRKDLEGNVVSTLDAYRKGLAKRGIGFFSYDGRGIFNGDKPPRFETIDWEIYNTSTLDNKVGDLVSALKILKKQRGVDSEGIIIFGISEGSYIAAMASAGIEAEVCGLVFDSSLIRPMRESFQYMMTEGKFRMFALNLDSDWDGYISQKEYLDDYAGFLSAINAPWKFEELDANGNGFIENGEILIYKYLANAARDADFDVLAKWAKINPDCSTPEGWFQDHFTKKHLWEYLKDFNKPVGVFHGQLDFNIPVRDAYDLENTARLAGKDNLFFYFAENEWHGIGQASWLYFKTESEGLKAMLDYMAELVK